MVKKKSTKKEKPLTLITVIGVTSVLFIGGFFIVGYFQQKNLKKKFNVLDKKISILEEKFNKYEVKKSKYCQRNQEKYKHGRLYCSVDLTIKNEESRDAFRDINTELINEGFKIKTENQETAGEVVFKNNTYHFNGIDCYLRDGEEIILSCFEYTNKEIF